MNIKHENLGNGWKRVSFTVTVPKESLWERVKALFVPKERVYTFSVYMKPEKGYILDIP